MRLPEGCIWSPEDEEGHVTQAPTTNTSLIPNLYHLNRAWIDSPIVSLGFPQ